MTTNEMLLATFIRDRDYPGIKHLYRELGGGNIILTMSNGKQQPLLTYIYSKLSGVFHVNNVAINTLTIIFLDPVAKGKFSYAEITKLITTLKHTIKTINNEQNNYGPEFYQFIANVAIMHDYRGLYPIKLEKHNSYSIVTSQYINPLDNIRWFRGLHNSGINLATYAPLAIFTFYSIFIYERNRRVNINDKDAYTWYDYIKELISLGASLNIIDISNNIQNKKHYYCIKNIFTQLRSNNAIIDLDFLYNIHDINPTFTFNQPLYLTNKIYTISKYNTSICIGYNTNNIPTYITFDNDILYWAITSSIIKYYSSDNDNTEITNCLNNITNLINHGTDPNPLTWQLTNCSGQYYMIKPSILSTVFNPKLYLLRIRDNNAYEIIAPLLHKIMKLLLTYNVDIIAHIRMLSNYDLLCKYFYNMHDPIMFKLILKNIIQTNQFHAFMNIIQSSISKSYNIDIPYDNCFKYDNCYNYDPRKWPLHTPLLTEYIRYCMHLPLKVFSDPTWLS